MAILTTTGPVHLYCSPGDPDDGSTTSFTPLYLGTGERAPYVEVTPYYKPLFASITGSETPFDYMWTGEDATIIVDLTRWNEQVYQQIVARPNCKVTGPVVRGKYQPKDVGTVMGAEGLTFDLWLQFPYAAKSTYTDCPRGYHFYRSIVIGPDGITPGTQPNKRRLIFKAWRYLKVADGTAQLYETNISGIPDTPPTAASGSVGS